VIPRPSHRRCNREYVVDGGLVLSLVCLEFSSFPGGLVSCVVVKRLLVCLVFRVVLVRLLG